MLQKRVLELESVLEVTRNANSLLKQELDNLQQYQCRACIIVDGITPVKHEMEEQMTAKTKNFLIKNLGFEERKVSEELKQMSSSWESKRWKTIHSYAVQISLIWSFHLCKQKQHSYNTEQEKIISQIIINKL